MQTNPKYLPLKIGLVSYDAVSPAGVIDVIRQEPGFTLVVRDLESLLLDKSILLLFLDMISCSSWTETALLIRRIRPDIRLMIVGPAGNNDLVLRSIFSGARGYLAANSDAMTIHHAVAAVMEGAIWAPRWLMETLIDRLVEQRSGSGARELVCFSERERQVLDLILTSRSNSEIACLLGVDEHTVKNDVAALVRKIGAKNWPALSARH